MNNNLQQSTSVEAYNTRNVGDVVFRALIPFPGNYSPEQVRVMNGPELSGPPSAIWRKTSIHHSNADGFFYLYVCERTGEAIWIPSGDYFVANRPLGSSSSSTSTVMDFLLSERRQVVRSDGYGIHHTGRNNSGENGNIRGPRMNHASVMRRVETTRLHRHSPLVRSEPAPAGTGARRTVARRERRERLQQQRHPTPPPSSATAATTTTTTTTISSTSAVMEGSSQGRGLGNNMGVEDGKELIVGRTKNGSSITIYNSTMGGHQADSEPATQIDTLDIWEEDDI